MTLFAKTSMALLLGVALVGGCDPSKEELEKTKDQLAKVTSERDQLKGQVDTMKVSMDAMKTELDGNKTKLADAETKLQACAPAAQPVPAADPKAGKTPSKSTGKTTAGKPPVAPTVTEKTDTTAPKGTATNPIKVAPGAGQY